MEYTKPYTEEDYFFSFREGEEKGFNYFFHLYYKPLVHFAYTIVNSKETAEDVVEDSFVKLWEKRATIESTSSIKPYLYITVRNGCIDLLRRQKNRQAHSLQIKKAPEEQVPDVSHKIIRAQSMHQLYLAIENLPPRHRQVLQMFYQEGKQLKEIAQEMNISLTTVKSLKANTLERLRKKLPHIGSLILFYLWL